MATQYGLTPFGFIEKTQAIITTEWTQSLQSTFGVNINLGPESVLGQIMAIGSSREALIWQLAGAIYRSQYPSGAEGASVDNLLAYNNLKRLPATPTVTNPTPLLDPATLITQYGLVLTGTPGTSIPAGSVVKTSSTPPVLFTTDAAVVIASAVSAIQTLFFSNTPTAGIYQISVIDQAVNTLTTPNISYNALANSSQITFPYAPITGSFQIQMTLCGTVSTTASIGYSATAANVQSAINAVSGYSAATVTGSFASGFVINWGATANPLIQVVNSTLADPATTVDSVQAVMNNVQDMSAGYYPYTDLSCAQIASGIQFNFGANSVVGSNPSSASRPQAIMTVATNTMENVPSLTATNLTFANTQVGAPAQAVASATCETTGPNFVAAGALNTIGTPISGWTGVYNQLDCQTGANVESDTAALIRRSENLNSTSNGPLQSIVEKVRAVANVTTAIGFENLYQAANQVITFGSVPSTGSFVLAINGSLTTSISYNATSSQFQAAVRTIPGMSGVLATGNFVNGFTIDFNGALGGQQIPLSTVYSNTLGVSINIGFGRPGKSFEIVAQGGADLTIAQAIYGSKPAGIPAYGSTNVTIQDYLGNPYNIGFSRPSTVPIYIILVLQTDLTVNPSNPAFSPASISQIQQDLVTIGNAFGIGSTVIARGTNGLIGAFNSVPGILDYQLYFGISPNPTQSVNIQMLPEQVPVFESFNVLVSYT